MEMGKKIRALRTARGLTQEGLAEELNVSSQAISKWETGQTMPDIALLPEIAVFFGVTVDELFCLTDDREFDRIQNMLWDERVISQAEADRAEQWLLGRIEADYRRGDCYALLADLYNHRSHTMRQQAAEYAKAALAAGADSKDAHSELNDAMGGYIPDWYARNHHELIDYYRGYVAAHPDSWRGYLWLMDNLMADGRFDEAETYLARFAAINDTCRVPLYRGLLAWYRGDRQEAHRHWEAMARDFGDDWLVWLSLGDAMAMESRCDEAVAYYRRALAVQKPPRYVDSYISIAHVCEIAGRKAEAAAAYDEAVALLAEEWQLTAGETVDSLRRARDKVNAKG